LCLFLLGVIIFLFGFVFIQKNNLTKIFYLKNIKLVRTNRFQFGSIFYDKNRFKLVGSVFWFDSILAWFFSIWLGFSVWLGFFGLAWFFFGLARFGFSLVRFFYFRLIKLNQTGRFFQNFNQFNKIFFTV